MGGSELSDQLLDPDVPTLASQDKLKVSPKGLPFVISTYKQPQWTHADHHIATLLTLDALSRIGGFSAPFVLRPVSRPRSPMSTCFSCSGGKAFRVCDLRQQSWPGVGKSVGGVGWCAMGCFGGPTDPASAPAFALASQTSGLLCRLLMNKANQTWIALALQFMVFLPQESACMHRTSHVAGPHPPTSTKGKHQPMRRALKTQDFQDLDLLNQGFTQFLHHAESLEFAAKSWNKNSHSIHLPKEPST